VAEHSIKQTHEATEFMQKQLDNIESGVTPQTVMFGNPELGPGSKAHWDDQNVFGHSRTFVDPAQPGVFHIAESQSDWGQAALPEIKQIAAEEKKIEGLKRWNEDYENAVRRPDLGTGSLSRWAGPDPDGHYLTPSGKIIAASSRKDGLINSTESIARSTTKINKLKKNNTYSPQRKAFHKKHSERFFQENLALAADEGHSKMRYPTSETAAKIQAYEKEIVPHPEVEALTKKAGAAKNKADNTRREIEKIESTKGLTDNQIQFAKTKLLKRYSQESSAVTVIQREKKNLIKTLPKPERHFSSQHKSILKKYDDIPKIGQKTLGLKPNLITDPKGNTWHEFDIPESFRKGLGSIKAFNIGGSVGAGQLPNYQGNTDGSEVKDRPVGIVPLEEFQIAADKETGQDYPYYGHLSEDQKKMIKDKSPVGRGIRSQATHGYGIHGNQSFTDSVYDFARAIPGQGIQFVGDALGSLQAAGVEEI